ncbi:LOW QUALITY PROTEIN: olfactory receptor 11L1-like [Mantella aurantiaca]
MNKTSVNIIYLLGFQNIHSYRGVLFLTFLLLYVVTILSNGLIIFLVSWSHTLSSPMYFFLSHLSSCDLLLSSVIVPVMMSTVIKDKVAISFPGCCAQLYFFGSLAGTECFLLGVMSFDRYMAICNPLRYISVVNVRKCIHLVVWSWFSIFALNTAVNTCRQYFCGPNIIDHYFCDFAPLLKLSCSDTTFVEFQSFILSLPVAFIPLMCITATYISITIAILRIPTSTGRQKAFYTCSSHLSIVFTYYGTLIISYIFPVKDQQSNTNKTLSLLYTVVTPLANPIIYSLRNKKLKMAFLHVFVCNKKHM